MVWFEGDIKKLRFESSSERSFLYVWSSSEILIFTLMQFTPPSFIFVAIISFSFKMKTAEFEAPGDPKAVAFSQMDTMEMCLLPELLWLCHAVMVLPTSLHSWGL